MDIVIPDKLQKQVLEIIKVKFNYPRGGVALTSGNTLIGDASNVAQPIPLNAMPYPIMEQHGWKYVEQGFNINNQ